MKLVFCGTPAFAVPTLEAVLAAGHEVALVIAQPDRAAGRGLLVEPGAVKAAAVRHGLEVLQPEKIRNNTELQTRLQAIAPDAILVVAYGRILPDWMLALPRFGCINLHGSLLPKYRGAAPIQWAVAMGETLTGVTTMKLDAGLDTGPLLLAQVEPIAPEETAADLFESLAVVGAGLMVRTLKGLAEGSIEPVEQNHAAATHAPILKREDGQIDPARNAAECIDRWRGFYPWPGAWTTLRGKKLMVHRMQLEPDLPQDLAQDLAQHPAGTLLVHHDRLHLRCADRSIELLELQVEGRKRLAAADFLRGMQVKTGERVGS